MIVVIPSIRNINLDILEPLLASTCKFIVVDDTDDERIQPNIPNMRVLHYSDRHRILGDLESCIPQKNGACRDLGLLAAYFLGQEDETIVCLDDDCEVFAGYVSEAENSLGMKDLLSVSTAHRFYNPLDLYDLDIEIFPRGFPYEERARPRDYSYANHTRGRVVFQLGLWKGVFDVNAIDKLYLDRFSFDDVSLRHTQVAVPTGVLVSLCSMNMILTRDLIPAIYQLPMNEAIIPHWQIDRYGDIWGGYICKHLIDIRGDILSVGEPLILHHKDSDLHKNIRQEHFAHLVNLQFCDLIDEACDGIKSNNYLAMYSSLVSNLEELTPRYPQALKDYLVPTVQKMRLWVQALGAKLDFEA